MKEKLRKILKHLLQTLKKEWLFISIITLLTADMTYQIVAMKTYKQDKEVQLYTKLSAIVASSEKNASVQSVNMTELLSKVNAQSKVYMLKDEKEKLTVLAQEGKQTMVVKHIPTFSMTFTLESKLLEKQIDYEWVEKKEAPQTVTSKLFDAKYLNLLLLVGLVYFLMMASGVKLFQKEFNTKKPKEIEGDFSNLVGYEDIKNEARQLLQIITQKEQYAQYGIDSTFNILFSGKAGTGKSKFALYLAKELNVPIVSSTGSLDEMYVGSGARKIRNLFKTASKAAENAEHKSCILFIDEGQNLLRKRGQSSEHKWEDDTANELLAHLDGVEKNHNYNIIVIIASNFHENNLEMDEAMLRRFKKKIHFREPNLKERKEILVHYLAKVENKAKHIDIPYIAKNMSGMTPAIIESVVQEAGLMALRHQCGLSTELLLSAFERMVIGKSSRAVTEAEVQVRKSITVHETGHFLVEYHRAMLLSKGDVEQAKKLTRILKISSESIEQIGALGFAMREQDESMMLQSVEDMEWEIKQLYGGMAAEQVMYGKSGMTTGGADDIQKATKLLKHLIVENAAYSSTKLNYEVLDAQEVQLQKMEAKAKALFEESLDIVQQHEGLLTYLSEVLISEWSLSKEALFIHINTYKQLHED